VFYHVAIGILTCSADRLYAYRLRDQEKSTDGIPDGDEATSARVPGNLSTIHCGPMLGATTRPPWR